METKIQKLKRFNIIMGTVHLIQGGLLFWLGTVVNSDFVVPITLTQLVGVGSPEDPSSFALVPQLEIWTEVKLWPGSCYIFACLSSCSLLNFWPFLQQVQRRLVKRN